MGVYIKGMEMPTSCGDCKAFVCYRQWAGDVGDCFCGITKNDAKAKEKNVDCPLVPVPTPHGRLGDLDEINEKHDKLSRDFCHGYFKSTWDFVCAARKIFYDAPTIIQASGGKEDE